MSEELKAFYTKKTLLKECAPIEMLKIGEEAELAFSRLLDVNNNITPMDYGGGVYDDRPTLQRDKVRLLNAD